MLAPPLPVPTNGNGTDLRRALYHLGPEAVRDFLLLAWAGELAATQRPRRHSERWIERLNATEAWEKPRFPLRGRDAMAEGVPHGPEIGRVLKTVEAWWEENDFLPDRQACLARLRALLASAGSTP